ncbi:MAG: hypothetical protein HOC27_01985, partial [Phycisphaerae bacterium]|nr:hypothetical protein [Phycisphaerae bacterium]
MLETTVDYWTCIELAQALEQTMRNDLWSTADRIAETASRISNKPEELVSALKEYKLKKLSQATTSEGVDTTTTTFKPDTGS